MEINTVIEVESFGDFDETYTEAIMVHSEILDVEEIYKEFYKFQNIDSNEGLDYRMLYSITQDFIAFLELKNFTKLKTNKIHFTD